MSPKIQLLGLLGETREVYEYSIGIYNLDGRSANVHSHRVTVRLILQAAGGQLLHFAFS